MRIIDRVSARRAIFAAVWLIAPATLVAAARPDAVAVSARRLHVALIKAEPGINDTVSTSPSEIKLWFSEPVQLAVTGARVIGPNNHMVPLGAMHVEPAAKTAVIATVTEKLESGKYTVVWKTMAEDGHPANGTFMFVVRLSAKKP